MGSTSTGPRERLNILQSPPIDGFNHRFYQTCKTQNDRFHFHIERVAQYLVEELLGQRLFGMCLGYEDLNDHDQLRADPMLAVAVGKADPLGLNRLREEDRGKALAGKSAEIDKYKKILMPSSPRWMAVRLRKRWSRSNVSWSFKI